MGKKTRKRLLDSFLVGVSTLHDSHDDLVTVEYVCYMMTDKLILVLIRSSQDKGIETHTLYILHLLQM